MATVPFTLRIDPEVKAGLEEAAKANDRTASYVAAKAIEAYLKAREEKRRILEEAVKEADKGVFISEEKMDAWMMSWGTDNPLPPPTPDIFLKNQSE